MASHPLPRGMSFFHPVCLTSTFFGIGLLPFAPGTWASLAALPIAWYLMTHFGLFALVAAGVALFLIGIWPATIYERRTSTNDPGAIVIDEVAAQLLVLTAVPPSWNYYMAGFVLFRLADILKPWPVSWADREVKGGFGIMLDDLLAALYAGVILYGIWLLFN
jgi:phosphatidylglycerophosphatase A